MPAATVTRRTHSPETKRRAVAALIGRGDKPVAAVAEKFGVSANSLYQWRDALAAAGETATVSAPNGHAHGGEPPLSIEPPTLPLVSGNGKAAVDMTIFDELAKLRAENAELRSLLKKLL